MLKRLLLAVLFFGLCSPAFASGQSLFGDLFGDDSDNPLATSHHQSHVTTSSGHLSITIDITTQEMTVADESGTIYNFDVSTGRPGHATPTGHFKPIRMNQIWYSSKYENAPMPWSIFFHGGYAIHGTNDIRHLGHVASHGCVRLHPDNAKALYALVGQYGMQNTDVILMRS